MHKVQVAGTLLPIIGLGSDWRLSRRQRPGEPSITTSAPARHARPEYATLDDGPVLTVFPRRLRPYAERDLHLAGSMQKSDSSLDGGSHQRTFIGSLYR